MSYPSIGGHLAEMGTTEETANDVQMKACFILAFKHDLMLGWQWLNRAAQQFKEGITEQTFALDSNEGRQIVRLIATDIASGIVREHFGLFFALIEPQKVIVAETEAEIDRAVGAIIEGKTIGDWITGLQAEYPLGFPHLQDFREKLSSVNGDRAMYTLSPKSDEGKEFFLLLGMTPTRRVLGSHFGMTLGLYNCCKGVGEDEDGDKKLPKMSMREQIAAQSPQFADC